MKKIYLAVDLGADSVRVIAGIYERNRLSLEEVARFDNKPITLRTGIFWNVLSLLQNVIQGVKKAQDRWKNKIISLGISSWGVDYAYFSNDGEMLGMVHTHRDPRTEGIQEYSEMLLPDEELYQRTGIHSCFINTLWQMLSEIRAKKKVLHQAERLLFIPDIINFYLTGKMVNERTMASISQIYNPYLKDWDRELINRMGLPQKIFREIIDAGELIGTTDIGGHQLNVIATRTHDTASAISAIPFKTENCAYQSSGTWSPFGFESERLIINEESRAAQFNNESGVDDTTLFLKNITGLWILQEVRRTWYEEKAKYLDYTEIVELARNAKPFQAFIDPDAPIFIPPDDMPTRICDYLKNTDQTFAYLDNPGQLARIIFESLALKCRYFFEKLESLSNKRFDTMHIVGGGSKNKMLNQFMANALKVPVVAGPVEATCIGNILSQLKADGLIKTLAEGRAIVERSFPLQTFLPENITLWDQAYDKFLDVVGLK